MVPIQPMQYPTVPMPPAPAPPVPMGEVGAAVDADPVAERLAAGAAWKAAGVAALGALALVPLYFANDAIDRVDPARGRTATMLLFALALALVPLAVSGWMIGRQPRRLGLWLGLGFAVLAFVPAWGFVADYGHEAEQPLWTGGQHFALFFYMVLAVGFGIPAGVASLRRPALGGHIGAAFGIAVAAGIVLACGLMLATLDLQAAEASEANRPAPATTVSAAAGWRRRHA